MISDLMEKTPQNPALALLGLAGFCGVFSITSLIITARSIARIGPGAP